MHRKGTSSENDQADKTHLHAVAGDGLPFMAKLTKLERRALHALPEFLYSLGYRNLK